MTVTRSADVEGAAVVEPERRTVAATIVLGAVVAVAAAVAVALHRNGHTQGDDFALYLRQARSLFDGDVAQVVADNRFTVINSGGAFSPIAYPWGWPLLLSPFVHLWGLDYDRLKLLEVAAFCVWLVLIHGIVRRRAGRLLALSVTAVVATAPALLAHTDQLLSEYPHAAVVAAFIWWMDRVKAGRPLIAANGRQLVVLGVIAAAAYNMRREGVILVAVIVVVQVSELLIARRRGSPVPVPWKTVATPYAAFAGSVIGFQLLLPSMLMPDNGDSPKYVLERIGDYTGVLTAQLGIGEHPAIGVLILLLAGAGMVVGCIRRPRLDIPLAALTVLSAATVSTHFRMVGRYYFQVTPWVLYFAAAAVVAGAGFLLRGRDRRMPALVAAAPLLFLVAVHVAVLPGDVDAAREFDARGRPQVGPTDPAITPIFDAVQQHTAPTDVIAYFRARTLTLYTDRRTIQTTNIDRVLQRADYFAQMRFSEYSQPDITPFEAEELGLVEVWSDERWILWRVPEPGEAQPDVLRGGLTAASGTPDLAGSVAPVDAIDVSVVLPVFNERGHLRTEIERIQRALTASPYTYEIIVVDDGSNDGSEVDLPTIDGIRLIRHSHNRGAGTARRTGTTAALGRIVVWTDVDMTYPNDEIPMLVKEMDGFDHVVGARRTEEGTNRVFRVPAKWFIRKLASYLTETDIKDLNSGLRAFRRDVAMQYVHHLPAGFSCVTTLTMSFLSNGYSVKYVPIDYFPRAGTSKFHWWRDTKRYLLQVVRMTLSYNPLKVFLPIGLVLLTVGLGKLVYDWIDKDFRLAANTLLILMASLQSITVGLLADLIVRATKPSTQVPPA